MNKDNLPSVGGNRDLAKPSDKTPALIRKIDPLSIPPLDERIRKTKPEVSEERIAICKNCVSFKDWACSINNKFLPLVTRYKSTTCPKGYWGANWDVNK
jgi:hypothetical protein